MKLVQSPSGVIFDAFQWQADTASLPDWLKHCHSEEDRFHGKLLMGVGAYRVKPGSWVLRSHAPRGDIFPVAGDMMWNHYEEVPSL